MIGYQAYVQICGGNWTEGRGMSIYSVTGVIHFRDFILL